MVERNHGEHPIRRFTGRGNKPDPRDVKIASLKKRIQKFEFPQLQQDSPAEEAKTDSNIWDDGSVDVNPFGVGNRSIEKCSKVGTLATIKSLKKPCISDFMKTINSTTTPPFTFTNELIHYCNPINTETHHRQNPLPPNVATIKDPEPLGASYASNIAL
nr:hypothetical protein [Tanacetum cinerariifolium]